MAPSKLRRNARPLLVVAAALTLLTPGCAAEDVTEARFLDCAPGGGCAHEPALDGQDPATFCDDHDPCTTDVDCTPCSAVPPGERDIYHCTADEDLPELCAGRAGCVHVPLTTPAGQADSCFPVADAADAHPGVCRAGRCVENDA